MTREELNQKNDAELEKMRGILQEIHDELNHGQLKKLLKNEKIKAAFDRFGVVCEEG